MINPELKPPFCTKHRVPMIWGETDFSYAEDGIEVIVRHIPAWVCPHGDDAAFAPGTGDEIIETVRELIQVARRTNASQPAFQLQEYLVRVMA